jgi:hypothetical protein
MKVERVNNEIIATENGHSIFWFEGNILGSAYTVPHIDLTIAKDGVQKRLSIIGNKSYPIFIDISKVKSITKEARDYLGTAEASKQITAAGILASSYLSKMVGTFFLSFTRPAIPIKLFTSKAEAVRWLEKFL